MYHFIFRPTLNWAAGDSNVIEGRVITGAEDYSFYQERIPGLFLMLGVVGGLTVAAVVGSMAVKLPQEAWADHISKSGLQNVCTI